MPKKRVLLLGHSPLQKWDSSVSWASVPWADVWIRLKDRRKLECFGPCLCSKGNIKQDLWVDKEIVAHDEAIPNNGKKMSAGTLAEIKAEILDSEEILRRIEDGEIVVAESEGDGRIEGVYTGKDEIDRDEAERMLRVYLTKYGYDPENIKFKWVKPKHVAWSA